MPKLKTNPDNQDFIDAVKVLKQGETIEVDDGVLIVEEKFTEPTHFLFHQRIFDPGIILNKLNPKTEQITKLRIYISGEKLGWKKNSANKYDFDDRQITKDGKVLKAER